MFEQKYGSRRKVSHREPKQTDENRPPQRIKLLQSREIN
ncbi:uncharacterized protein METZ01_LOCUS443055, partial [marine metagenome]